MLFINRLPYHNKFRIGGIGTVMRGMALSDLEMLKKINRRGKIQLIFAGKAHPNDGAGKQLIRDIFKNIEILREEIKIVFLENYDMDLAGKMVSGVDIWLNTPTRPYEASGTSGMPSGN